MSTTLQTRAKAHEALDTLHHYLRLAARNEPFDQPNAMAELAVAIDDLKEVFDEVIDDCLKLP